MTDYVKCMEFCFGTRNERADSIWVRLREQISMTDMMGGYDRSSDPEEVDEAFCRQLEEASCSLALVLIGDLNRVKYLLEGTHRRAKAIQALF